MIQLTRLNHVPVVLNSDLIEHIEVTPDTVISLTTGQTMVVLETADEVIRRIVEFRRLIFSGIIRHATQGTSSEGPPPEAEEGAL